jgi:SecD/SecF fusion protein
MQNKGLVIFLAIVITALCLYYLSFTYVSYGVRQEAIEFATSEDDVVSLNKKQRYLDSVWNLPVYNLFGAEYTYKEVKDNELSLGLDLQGGMHVTLEVSPVDIIKSLAANSQDSSFLNALKNARAMQLNSQENFSDLFFESYREANPTKKLASIFANAVTKNRIATNDDDDVVIDVVNLEIESAIDRSFTILNNRLDQFGTSQPVIQRLPGTARIQIEIPGADNPQRVRKLLQGVAKLEFWDVIEPNTLNNSLLAINDVLVKEQNSKPASSITGDASTVTPDDSQDLSSLLGDNDSTGTTLFVEYTSWYISVRYKRYRHNQCNLQKTRYQEYSSENRQCIVVKQTSKRSVRPGSSGIIFHRYWQEWKSQTRWYGHRGCTE